MRTVHEGVRVRRPLPTMTKGRKGSSRSPLAIVLLLVAVAALVLYFERESIFGPETPGTGTEGAATDEETATGSEATAAVSGGTDGDIAADESESFAEQVAERIVERIEEKVAETADVPASDSVATTSPPEELQDESDEALQATDSSEAPTTAAADSSATSTPEDEMQPDYRDRDSGRGPGNGQR